MELLQILKNDFTLKKFFKGLGLKKAAIVLSWRFFLRNFVKNSCFYPLVFVISAA